MDKFVFDEVKKINLIDITGKALSGEWGTDDETGEGIPVLRTTNFTNEGVVDYSNVVTRVIQKKNIKEKFLRYGDIIIEKSGGSDNQPVGRVVFFEDENDRFLFNNFTGLLRVKDCDNWFQKYVFYALFYNYHQGGTRQFENRTTGLHNLKTDDYVSRFQIKQLPLDQQKRICLLLDKVSTLLELRRTQLEKLDTLIKARFIEMFGDPEFNTKGLPVVCLSDLCEVGSSKRIYQSEQSMTGIPFLRISDLVTLIDTGELKADLYIPESRYKELKLQGLVPISGDILVTSRGTLGRCYIVQDTDVFYFQDGMISWLSKFSGEVMSLYIEYLFAMNGFRKQIDELQAGSTVAYLSIAMLKKLKIMVPPLALQQQFAAFVQATDKSKSAIKKSLNELQILFDSLMQEYFG